MVDTETIPITLAVEDDLSEAVLRAILCQSNRNFIVGRCLKKQGSGYLKRNISGLNQAAQGSVYLVLTDLDRSPCPLALMTNWLPQPKHPNLIFRVAVREVESWVLADRNAFAQFLGINVGQIPPDLDAISDPKQLLINLARKSRKRKLKDAIIPASGSTAKVGKDYNGPLVQFVKQRWDARVASTQSRSLDRAVQAIAQFQPQ